MAYSKTIPFRVETHVSNQRASSPLYVWQNYGSQASTPVILDGSRAGSALPGWREKIQRGSNATTVFDSDRTKVIRNKPASGSSWTWHKNFVQGPNGRVYTHGNWTKCRWDAHTYSLSKPTHGNIAQSDAGSKALYKILSQIRKEQVAWSGGTALGELRESIRMLRNPAAGLISLINKQYVSKTGPLSGQVIRARKSRRRGESPGEHASRVASDVSAALRDLWLETSFGWGPAISDVREAAEAVARFHHEAVTSPRVIIKRLQGSGRFIPAGLDFGTTYWKYSDPEGQATVGKRWSDHTVKYVVGYLREEKVGTLEPERLLQLLGFQWSEFVPTVWNLLPWSFLLDYFVRVGDLLEAASTDTTAVAWISRTDRLVTTDVFRSTPKADPYIFGADSITRYFNLVGAHAVIRRTTISRTSPSTLGVPPLTISNPFGKPWKMANMLALWSKAQENLSSNFTKATDRKRKW